MTYRDIIEAAAREKTNVVVSDQVRHKSGSARWRSGRASESESRGPVFDAHRMRHRVVSLSRTH